MPIAIEIAIFFLDRFFILKDRFSLESLYKQLHKIGELKTKELCNFLRFLIYANIVVDI